MAALGWGWVAAAPVSGTCAPPSAFASVSWSREREALPARSLCWGCMAASSTSPHCETPALSSSRTLLWSLLRGVGKEVGPGVVPRDGCMFGLFALFCRLRAWTPPTTLQRRPRAHTPCGKTLQVFSTSLLLSFQTQPYASSSLKRRKIKIFQFWFL